MQNKKSEYKEVKDKRLCLGCFKVVTTKEMCCEKNYLPVYAGYVVKENDNR